MPPESTPIHVIGIGLDGADGLAPAVRAIAESATLLVGNERSLDCFAGGSAEYVVLGDLQQAIEDIRLHLGASQTPTEALRARGSAPPENGAADPDAGWPEPLPDRRVVVLTSGDPLFFGFGRLLLAALPAAWLSFHPHVSSVQLAFARVKLPWQTASVVSVHGRSPDELLRALRRGVAPIAVLTDPRFGPAAIAELVLALDLPQRYDLWVCENLGGPDERVQGWLLDSPQIAAELRDRAFASPNVVVLERVAEPGAIAAERLPVLGLPDASLCGFADRPGLMTKREVRVLALAELDLRPGPAIVWDVGSGTGSVAVEIARLCPEAQVYAVEQTATGINLVERNAQRFGTQNLVSVRGSAPEVLARLPQPDRAFVGGSSGRLLEIFDLCAARIAPDGRLVATLATLESQAEASTWLAARKGWASRWLQVHLAHSVPVGPLTRFAPLNPVWLLSLWPEASGAIAPGFASDALY